MLKIKELAWGGGGSSMQDKTWLFQSHEATMIYALYNSTAYEHSVSENFNITSTLLITVREAVQYYCQAHFPCGPDNRLPNQAIVYYLQSFILFKSVR